MNINRQQRDQLFSRLRIGQNVDIQRSNGRIHPAVITEIHRENQSVTVEWKEKHEGKGKELDLDTIIQLNPDLFPSVTSTSRQYVPTDLNQTMVTRSDRRSRAGGNDHKQSQPPLTSRSNGHSNATTPFHFDSSPHRHQNYPVPGLDGNKSKVVKRIEQIAANREQRRAEQEERRQKNNEVDHSIPAWEFQNMVQEYRQGLAINLLKMNDPLKNLRICVCVRKRPISKRELNKKDIDVLTVPNKDHVILHLPKVKVDLTKYIDNQTFRFDYCFHESAQNDLVYHFTARPLVESLFQGNNPMVFAYGQTGSGKTFTMGADLSQRDLDVSKGIYALTASDIFRRLSQPNNRGQFDAYCTFFEIYCTKVFDLFNEKRRLRVLEDHKNLVQVVGKKEERIEKVEEVMMLIRRGMSVRTSGTTSANENSSRSHAVFQIILKRKNTNKEFGKISLIDLAGSERGRDTQTNDKVTMMEGAQINKSLLTLKECIRALGRNAEHIPFRGSTLTKVLRDSFIGERSKVCMVAMVSPGNSDAEHTLNTLRYADRVKELNVEELRQRGAGGHAISEPEDYFTEEDNYDTEDDLPSPKTPHSNRPTVPKETNVKRPLGHQGKNNQRKKFEEATARSHEIEDQTLETHHRLIDEFPQMEADHRNLLDLSTHMNYDRENYAKKLINLVDNQQKHLTKLRSKAANMRDAVAHEDNCAKALGSK